jgi:hypothetical protein
MNNTGDFADHLAGLGLTKVTPGDTGHGLHVIKRRGP